MQAELTSRNFTFYMINRCKRFSYFADAAFLLDVHSSGGFLPEEERERFFGLDGERRAASNAQVNMPPAPWPPANSVMSTSSVVSLNGTKVKEPRKTAEYHRMQLRNSLLSLRLLISSTNENPPSMIQILAQATAAIRQTRDYVCQHYSAQLTLESDRRLRQDALGSLEVIRHTSECNEMQLTPAKRQILNRWTEGVQRLLDEEETVRRDFTSASWFVNHAMGTWEDTYLPFLTYFDTMLPSLSPSITQTDVLTALRDGQRLCQIHNNCQAFIRSRPFYAIRSDLIHSDTTLQYRGVENLTRWWVAVERSWLVVDNTLSALMPWSPDAAWRGEGHGVQALKERIELFCSAAVRVLVAEA